MSFALLFEFKFSEAHLLGIVLCKIMMGSISISIDKNSSREFALEGNFV
jgi:hypothetical protein